MHIVQRDQEAKNTPRLRGGREINQECKFLGLQFSLAKKVKSNLIRRIRRLFQVANA